MTQENAKIIADYLLGQTEYEMATTRNVLSAVPADANYKPSDKCMSGLDLAAHIAVCEVFFLSGVINGRFEWAPPELKTPAEALAYYEEKAPELIAAARGEERKNTRQNTTHGPK